MMEEQIARRTPIRQAKIWQEKEEERKAREQKYLVQVRRICYWYVLPLGPW